MLREIANNIPLGTSDVKGFDARVKDYVLGKIKEVMKIMDLSHYIHQ